MFVTFEGPEGAGKSTLIQKVSVRLHGLGHEVLCTREPGAGHLGREIRELLLHGHNLCPESELFLFLADRSNHVAEIILPALHSGQIVLCDRFADSTWVYQGFARGIDPEFVSAANQLATRGLTPNLTLLLDLPPEMGLARIQNQDRLDGEPIEFHRRVREGFLRLSQMDGHRWTIIDATQTPAQVEEKAIEIITIHLSGKNDFKSVGPLS